jgi:mannosyltransferase OCH1-like enzyme
MEQIMIPAIIHQTAKSELSWEEHQIRRRMRRMLPGWEYRMWNDRENESLIEKHFPRHIDAYRHIRKGVVRADIARYAYLWVSGGFYFDTDYKLLQPIADEMRRHHCVLGIEEHPYTKIEPDGRETHLGLKLGNACIGSVPGYSLWNDFIDHIFSQSALDTLTEDEIVPRTGPRGLSNYYLAHRDRYPDVQTYPQRVFYPVLRYSNFWHDSDATTVGVHLSWGSWRNKSGALRMRNFLRRKLTALY